MPYNIEILTVKEDLYKSIKTACDSLNKVQGEFFFGLPPDRLKANCISDKIIPTKSNNIIYELIEIVNGK